MASGSGSEHSMATSQARDSAEHNEIASQSRAIKRRTQEEEAEPKVAAAKAEVAAAKAEVAAAKAEVAEAEAKVVAARAEVAEAITAYENANTNHQSACTVLQSACTVHQSATNKLAMLINETTTASSPFKKPRVSSSVLQECGTQQLQQSQAEGMQTICFFNGDDKEEPFIRVTCDLNGRMWSRLYLFMTSVCGHFDIKDYDIKQKDTNEIIDIAFDSLLLPGMYTITAKQSTSRQICVLDTYRESRIIPRQRQNSESQVSTPRTSTFKSRVTLRDKGACVITGDTKRAQACHIVAKAHWNNQENLPQSIKRLFISFPETINDVRNGLLLCPNLHGAFDDGDISIKYDSNANIYFVVAIDIAYQKLDGTLLWLPPPTSLPLPHPDLLDFHLALSVMKHMCAAAEYDEDDPYSDFDIPQVQRVEAY